MLEIENLRAGYAKTTVVDDVTITFEAGTVTALLGRNGVGKTTLLRAMFGLCDRQSGRMSIDGVELPAGRAEVPARHGMTLLPDDRGVFATLTIEENLRLATRRGYHPPVDVKELFPLLVERAEQPAGQLSGGQKQQVGIARAILAGQRFIAIDELSQGLQPSLAQATLEALRVVASTGVGVLFVEQSPRYPLAYADRIIGMVKGRLVLDRSADELRTDPAAVTELLVVS
ncbi:amino acid/amide ABC transporter ATP-binding protein 2 (HAAT family) [Homoserinimonas aerilata]|uniref:Amino acid/amide ABC transporter ATP-binding protein 2 (HAAT family) n=1 Tax=Homoserinimonas aerilata TaxID=1162970 RepID=A0A542YEY4_9MICO|nr:ATP-binding cassette domain-containing protein [Homoserinimonas aerilata]TQL46655.1 amino acid/amide ABC transporter ATP-binding protein 2 (HAAT family) [Homoserinimonas aerilata]